MAAKDTGKLAVFTPLKGSRPTRPMRVRKMIAPMCKEHFPGDGSINPYSNWVRKCIAAGHDPYMHAREIERVKPVLEERDGVTYKVGEEKTIEYRMDYNWREVPNELRISSGVMVAHRLRQHWKMPEDFGFAPFCEYKGCPEQNPKFRTPVGDYHNRDEA